MSRNSCNKTKTYKGGGGGGGEGKKQKTRNNRKLQRFVARFCSHKWIIYVNALHVVSQNNA